MASRTPSSASSHHSVLEKPPTNNGQDIQVSHPPSDPLRPDETLPKGQGDVDAYASTFNPGKRFYTAFGSLMVITLMAALDATSLSVAIPKITRVLNGTAIEGFWSGTSFLLTSTVSNGV